MVTKTEKTDRASEAPALAAGAAGGSVDPPAALFDLLRLLETDRQLKEKRFGTIGMVMAFALFLITLSVIWAWVMMIPHLSDKEYVMFEVEKSTGVVRMVHELHEPYTPDEGIRQYFITQLVQHLETFDRHDVDRMANVLRHFVSQEVLARYVARMQALNESIGTGKRLVTVDSILPITTHENAQSYNQSTVDFVVTVEKRDGTKEVRPMVAILTYRFVPYTKAELESDDEDMNDKRLKNPLGMEVSEYRVDAKLPVHQSTN